MLADLLWLSTIITGGLGQPSPYILREFSFGILCQLLPYLIRKEGKGLSPSLRAAQLYESVRIRPVVVEEAVVGVMPKEAKKHKKAPVAAVRQKLVP